MPTKQDKGTTADAALRALNFSDAGLQGVIGFERLRRLAQGNTVLAKQAATVLKSYTKLMTPVSLAIEVGNAAWLASDSKKRDRASQEFDSNANKPAIERGIESVINPSDTIFASGKAIYDTGKTYESIERSRMDEINNSLLRKIAVHKANLELERKKQLEKSQLADYVMSAIKLKR